MIERPPDPVDEAMDRFRQWQAEFIEQQRKFVAWVITVPRVGAPRAALGIGTAHDATIEGS